MKVPMPLAKNVLAPLGLTAPLKGVSKTIKNETKEQKGGFLSMLLGTLGASLLGNLLTGGKGSVASRAKGEGIMRAGEGSVASRTKVDGIVKAGEGRGSKKKP